MQRYKVTNYIGIAVNHSINFESGGRKAARVQVGRDPEQRRNSERTKGRRLV